MSKKNKLLQENQIRRFMKLASIEPLTETFVDKIKETEEEVLEEAKKENLQEFAGPTGAPPAYDRDEEELADLAGPEGLEGLEEPEGLDGLEEPEGLEEPCETEALADLLSKVGDAVETWADEHGIDVSVDVETEGEGEPELEGPMPEPEEFGVAPEEEEEEEEEEMLPALEESVNLESLLGKVTQRVTARIHEQNERIERRRLQGERIDEATDNIVERIFSSAKK